jgi:glycosyltransferase involved in cell wall biosynthesis
MVVTVYDMIHEKFSLDKSLLGSFTKKKKALVKKANKVIAISNSTKKDLVEIFEIPSNKIEVIHLANSLPTVTEPEQIPEMPQRYILFVGERSFYKNFHNFVIAAREFLKKDCNLHIVTVGGKGFSETEQRWIEELDIKKQIIHKKLDDQSLAFFYKKALCFVFPSKYEGFGIPILEAFACGCPLICSNTSSFPEVAGDAAIYFEPNQIESITQALDKVLNSETLRQEMVERGYIQSQKFSWKMTAQKTFELYQSLLKKT